MAGNCAKLYTGALMPMVGLGTWKSSPGVVSKAVEAALDCGYRHIDCAPVYMNEGEVGEGLNAYLGKDSAHRREDIFITSKLWNTMHAAEDVKPACQQTLKDLGLNYLDLYLMHWPYGFKKTATGEYFPHNNDGSMMYSDVSLLETWGAMEKLVDEGLCKHIGVSNFNSKQIAEVYKNARIKPAVVQVECHPYFNQSKLLDFCKEKGIVMTAYSPLGSPDRPWAKPDDVILLKNPLLETIATKHNRSPAQVVLRFNIQRGVIVIPKSATPSRIAENKKVFDFALTNEEMESIESLQRGNTGRVCRPASVVNGETIEWAYGRYDYPYGEEF